MAHRDVDLPSRTRTALDALEVLSGKWEPVVLGVLIHRSEAGFNDLHEEIPEISGKVLSDTLDSLQDQGLVERSVVNESPLRVEYALTDAGSALEPVLDALETWSEDHLGSLTPTVLVAEEDRRLTEMYSGWLENRYSVTRAHDSDAIDEALDGDTDAVLFGRQISGVDPASIPAVAAPETRTILLVDDRPDLDLLDVDCDDVLLKPLVRDRAIAAIERQLSRTGEAAALREYRALRAKRDVIERSYATEELSDLDAYGDLCSRIEALAERLDD